MAKQQKVTFMRDMKKVSTRRMSLGGDTDSKAAARAAGHEAGESLMPVLEMGGDVSIVRVALVNSLINALSDRVDENFLNEKLDTVSAEDRPAFFAGLFDKIMD